MQFTVHQGSPKFVLIEATQEVVEAEFHSKSDVDYGYVWLAKDGTEISPRDVERSFVDAEEATKYMARDAHIRSLQPGVKVGHTKGVLKGEMATVEVSPELGYHLQECEPGWVEVWVRYDKDGARLPAGKGHAILTPRFVDVDELKVVE